MEDTFPKRVYELVRCIPEGRVATYGQLALLGGKPSGVPHCGSGDGQGAPAGLPCHRVLYRDGSLCCERAFGGKAVQRQLLEREGVPFLPDGRVDLRLCLWQPAAPGCEFGGE